MPSDAGLSTRVLGGDEIENLGPAEADKLPGEDDAGTFECASVERRFERYEGLL